jgi:hypothetical protein
LHVLQYLKNAHKRSIVSQPNRLGRRKTQDVSG